MKIYMKSRNSVVLFISCVIASLMMTSAYAANIEPSDFVGKTMFWDSTENGETTIVNMHGRYKFVYSVLVPNADSEKRSNRISRSYRWLLHENEGREHICILASRSMGKCFKIKAIGAEVVEISTAYFLLGKSILPPGDRRISSRSYRGILAEDYRATMRLASMEDGDKFQMLQGYANQVRGDWQGPQGKMAAFMAGIITAAGASSNGGGSADGAWKRGRANGHCAKANC